MNNTEKSRTSLTTARAGGKADHCGNLEPKISFRWFRVKDELDAKMIAVAENL